MSLVSNVHNTAIISKEAKIGKGVIIGPYCIVSGNVEIGDNTVLRSNVVIDGNVKIGTNCDIFPFVSIGFDPQAYDKKHPEAKVIIGDDNIIREGVTISAGSTKENLITKIGNKCLLMAYSHVAHDCVLANGVILANNVAIAGHVKIDSYAIVGGNSAVHQFCRIGSFAMISGSTGIIKDVLPFTMYVSHHVSEDLAMHAGLLGVNMVGLKRANFSRNDILNVIDFYNHFLNHADNRHEKGMHIIEKYQKYRHIITNSEHSNIIKQFVEEKSKQGAYRDLIKVRNI